MVVLISNEILNLNIMVVRKKGDSYAVVHCHGKNKGKVIKSFPTKKQANEMHKAIQANKRKK